MEHKALFTPLPYALWSESFSSILRGLRTRPSHLSIKMTSYYVRDLYDCWFQASTQFLLLLVCCQLNHNLDMMLLSDYANPCECLKSFSEHLHQLCCPSHPRFLNSLMHLQIPSSHPDVLWARLSTLIGQLRYSVASTYMLELLLRP